MSSNTANASWTITRALKSLRATLDDALLARLKPRQHILAPRAQGGRQCERNSGDEREAHRVGQDTPIGREVQRQRAALGGRRKKSRLMTRDVHSAKRQAPSQAANANDEPFDEQRTDDAETRGPERVSHRRFPLADSGPRQHQISHVRARR